MRRARGSGSLRSRLAWSATGVVALWLVLLTAGGNLLIGSLLAREADATLRARAESVAQTVSTSADGRLVIADARDDQALDVGTWIFAADGTVAEGPPGSAAALDREAARLVARGNGTLDRGPTRLLVYPVRDGDRLTATVVTSVSLAPYRDVARLALLGSIGLGLLLLVVVHLVLRANVGRALRPVQQMSAQAARWSAHDVDRRFGTAPRPAELAQLAGTLDGVLDRLSAVLRRDRQLVDELSHELRTPLARIRAETDLLRSRPRSAAELARAHEAIDDSATGMQQILSTLITTAREPHTGPPGRAAVAEAVQRLAEAHGWREVEVAITPDLRVGVDAVLLERLLAPVLANAVRHARSAVTVSAVPLDGVVEVVVTDDGSGVPAELAEQVFQPGFRADPDDGHDGAGLGLALARRLAEAAGGTLTAAAGPGGRFVARLPPG